MVDKRSGGEGHGQMDALAEQDSDEADSEFEEVDPTGRYGRYKEVLGKGAFKTVYRAFDELEGMEVAWNQVKVQDVLQSPEDLERLYSEVHLLKTLKHKNIIKFYNSWVDTKNDNINFITEIFTSGTLRQYRKKHKHVDIRAVKNWSRQILRGLLYLHSHDPPIIHRDLKCDNIFVNGNQGEVKIGDLGLAAILRQAHAAHSVIGTPEFMAPELYEEEYNELVDIYAFGMCLLEMITFEYPYSECANAAQIYKKVTLGVKPAALDKVKDPEVRQFVEKCLATVSKRLPARELLMDPFLQCEVERESTDPASLSSQLYSLRKGLKNEPSLGSSFSEASYASKLGRGNFERAEDLKLPGPSNTMTGSYMLTKPTKLEHYHHQENYLAGETSPSCAKEDNSRVGRGFTVKGQRKDHNTVFFSLRIADSKGHARNIHFPFDIDADTAINVASEMEAELDLSDQDVTTIAAMIDAEIQALVPEWKPGAAFEDTVDEDMCTDYHSSAIEDDFSEIVSDMDSPSGAFVLERLPSGRKYWSDSPKSLARDSYMKTALMNASSRVECLMHGRYEEVSCNQSVPGSAYDQCIEGNFSSESDNHEDDGDDLGTGTESSKSLESSDLHRNVLMINQAKNHSHTEVVKSTVVAGLKTPTAQVNCKVQDKCKGTSQLNLQMEDCKIRNDLDQQVYAGKHDNKNLPEVESGVAFSYRTDTSTDLAFEDDRSVAHKLEYLLLKQQEELEGLKQKHEQALQDLINQLLQKGCSMRFISNGLSLTLNDFRYKVPVIASVSSASKIEQSNQMNFGSFGEESDAIVDPKLSFEEFNNATSIRKEIANEASCKDIDMESAKRDSTSGLTARNELSAEHAAYPLDKKIITKETKHLYSAKSTGGLHLSSLADSMSKMETVCQQTDTSTSEKCFKQDITDARCKLENTAPKVFVSNGIAVSHGIDKPGKRESFIEFYKSGSPLRDKPNSYRGVLKASDVDKTGHLSTDLSKSKGNDNMLDQLKKEQLQKSIADLEAKTLEGLKQSKSGFLIGSSGKKYQVGVSQAIPVGSNASSTRQQAAPELSKV
eukprot:Gb_22252 [translate_table: standard]